MPASSASKLSSSSKPLHNDSKAQNKKPTITTTATAPLLPRQLTLAAECRSKPASPKLDTTPATHRAQVKGHYVPQQPTTANGLQRRGAVPGGDLASISFDLSPGRPAPRVDLSGLNGHAQPSSPSYVSFLPFSPSVGSEEAISPKTRAKRPLPRQRKMSLHPDNEDEILSDMARMRIERENARWMSGSSGSSSGSDGSSRWNSDTRTVEMSPDNRIAISQRQQERLREFKRDLEWVKGERVLGDMDEKLETKRKASVASTASRGSGISLPEGAGLHAWLAQARR